MEELRMWIEAISKEMWLCSEFIMRPLLIMRLFYTNTRK